MSPTNKPLTPPKPNRPRPFKFPTPPRPRTSQSVSVIRPPRPTHYALHFPAPVLTQRSSNPNRRRRPRVNQPSSTASGTPRRKPRTPQHPLRSSRNSPPRFGDDSNPDNSAGRGSPLPFNNEDDTGFTFNDFSEMETEEPIVEPELSLNEKHGAIIETLQKIVPDYWDVLQQEPYSHARLSNRCFIIQELDPKTSYLKVSSRIRLCVDLF